MSYKELKSFQTAVIIYDLTVEFCDNHIDKYSRTRDQMVQAARSGKQNIAEGSSNRTSEKSELKLLGVARSSFTELLEDYEDFLRQHKLKQWEKDDPRTKQIRTLAYKADKTYQTYKSHINSAEDAANIALCLINQVNFLLDRQIAAAEEKFTKHGGYTEKLFSNRVKYRADSS